MNLSIVMMKQRAICVVISALRDNWNLQRLKQFIIGSVPRAERVQKSNHASTEIVWNYCSIQGSINLFRFSTNI